MKPARNMVKERMASVEISSTDLEKQMYDSRNGMRHGTVKQVCNQFAIGVRVRGSRAILSAPRDRLQLVVEYLHYCGVEYAVSS